MRKVWKYPLKMENGRQEVMIPQGGKVVHIDNQNHSPTLWVEVNSMESEESRTFCVIGTGQGVPTYWDYVGTCLIPPFVWHVYEWKGYDDE